jgi:hypothetical protein
VTKLLLRYCTLKKTPGATPAANCRHRDFSTESTSWGEACQKATLSNPFIDFGEATVPLRYIILVFCVHPSHALELECGEAISAHNCGGVEAMETEDEMRLGHLRAQRVHLARAPRDGGAVEQHEAERHSARDARQRAGRLVVPSLQGHAPEQPEDDEERRQQHALPSHEHLRHGLARLRAQQRRVQPRDHVHDLEYCVRDV